VSVIDTLVTNRQAGAKYNCADLNRVESAFEYLGDKMNGEFGFNLSLNIKKDWTRNDLGQLGAQNLMEQYRQNLVKIRGAITMMERTPQAPDSMRFLWWYESNDIEQILIDMEDSLNRMQLSFPYCGEAYCGEV
jgi:hypothetical protein